MSNLQPRNTNLRRLTLCGLAGLVLVSLPVSLPVSSAKAQTFISREITALGEGYCFNDSDSNGSFTIADIPDTDPDNVTSATLPAQPNDNVTDGGATITINQPELSGGNSIGASGTIRSTDLAPGTYNIDISGLCIGGVSRTDTITVHVDDDDDDSTDDATDNAPDAETTATSTATVTSDSDAIYDDDGFQFDGNINLTFAGQVAGNVELSGATRTDNVTLNFTASGLEITGNLDLGSGGAAASAVTSADVNIDATIGGDVSFVDATNVAADIGGTITGDINFDDTRNVTLTSDATAARFLANNMDNAVLTIGGSLTRVNLDDAVDVTATISATSTTVTALRVEDAAFTLSGGGGSFNFDSSDNISITNSATASTFSAQNITNGLRLTNTGTINILDVDGTDYLTLDLQSGSTINSLVMSDITNTSSYVTNAGGIGAVQIDNTSAVESVDLLFTNSGSIATTLDEAFVVDSSGSGAVRLEVRNSGTIAAASSDSVNITGLQSGSFTLNNTGSISTTSSTNNAINASGVQASIFITNGGSASISNNNNLALNFENMVGNFSLITAGRIQSNQTTINLNAASATTASVFEICNGYERDSNGNCSEVSAGTREIKAFGSNAIVFDGMTADLDIFNGADATIIAEDTRAIAASGVTGSVNIQNKGDIRAFRTAAGVSNEQAVLLENITGDITLANIGSDSKVDARDRVVNLEVVNGAIDFSNAGTIEATQPIAGADAMATDNYAVRLLRSGTSARFDVFASSGVISSTADHAVLAEDLVCDDNREDDEYCFTNSGSMTAERQFAFVVDNISDFSMTNSGTITARDRTFDASDLSGDIVIHSASAIRATYFFNPLYVDPDSDSYVMRLAKETGEEGDLVLRNSGIISSVPVDSYAVSSADEDTTAAPGSAILVTGFTEADDSVQIDNTGTIETPDTQAIDVTGQRAVTITNNAASAVISAVNDFAVQASAVLGSFSLENNGGSITADNYAVNAPSIGGAVSFTNNGGTISADDFAIFAPSAASTVTISSGADGSGGSIAASGVAISVTDATGLVTLNHHSGSIRSAENVAFDASNGAAGLTMSVNGTIAASGVAAVQAAGVTGAMSFTVGGQISNAGSIAINAPNATSTVAYTQSAGTVSADSQVLNFPNAAGAVTMTITGGTIQSLGAEAIDLADAGDDITLTNAGIITAVGTTVNMRNAGGDIGVINQVGGTISSGGTQATALDVANAGGEVLLVNRGTISAPDKTIIATGLAAGLSITNHSGGTISSTADEIIDATGVDDAVLVNNGTLRGGDSGTLVMLTGDDVSVTNSGLIEGGDTALLLGSGATLINSGTIKAGSSSGVALSVDGTGAEITLNDGSVLLGDIVAATPIADPDDRHQITLDIDVSKSFAFEFDDNDFAVTGNDTDIRPVVEGSAHAVSPYINYSIDTLHGIRAAGLRQNFFRAPIGANRGNYDVKVWGLTGERDSSTDQPFDVEVSEYGSLAGARLFQLFGADIALLLAYDTIEMDIAGDEQSLSGAYIGTGLGVRDLKPFEFLALSGYVLAGQSSNETTRKVYGNKIDNGVQTISGDFNSLIIDAGVEANMRFRFGPSWQIEARAGAAASLVSSDGFDEGTFYRHDDHETMLVSSNIGFNIAYDLQQGYLKETDFLYLDATLGVDSFADGDEYDVEFLAASIADADDTVRYEDDNVGGQQNRLTFGYHRAIDGETAIDFSLSRRFMDDGLEMDEAQLSVFVRF